MQLEEYVGDDPACGLMAQQGLLSFDALWALEAGWFEEPNRRRGGWSGVSRYALASGDAIFIKRQENHVYRSWRNFFRSFPTFEREFRNLKLFKQYGIPTLDLLYFGQKKVDGCYRAILVTRELAGYQPADADCFNPLTRLDRHHRASFIRQLTETVRKMHMSGFRHNCLYPKHVFVKENGEGAYEARLIDLEKAKKSRSVWAAAIHDLSTLYRHVSGWSRTDQLRFFLAYRQTARLNMDAKNMLRSILNRKRRK